MVLSNNIGAVLTFAFVALFVCMPVSVQMIHLEKLSTVYLPHTYVNGVGQYMYDKDAAVMSTYDEHDSTVYAIGHEYLHVIDISNVTHPAIESKHQFFYAKLRAIEFCDDYLFIAMTGDKNTGRVEVYQIQHAPTEMLVLVHNITVGVKPEMIQATSNCRTVVVAMEGSPYNNGSDFVDPEGAVGIIRFTEAAGIGGSYQYTKLDFKKFDNIWQELVSSGVRFIYRENNNSFSNDVEPEYITFNKDESVAYIALQENNAIAEVDMATLEITDIHPLGYKNWTNSKLDVSDRDNMVNIRQWPVMGMYQPDAIKFITIGDKSYLLTANEGRAKDYSDIVGSGGFNEESRVADLTIDGKNAYLYFFGGFEKKVVSIIWRLMVSNLEGKHGDAYDDLYTFGGRSISLYDVSTFNQVYDSGSEIEEKIAQQYSGLFNANGKSQTSVVSESKDSRSDAKGPEVESLAVVQDGNTTVIFVGIERPGLIAVYSIPGDVSTIRFESLWSGITRTNDTFGNLYDQRLISDIGPDDLR
ncbi:Mesenchyme-specific cell surface glycoprotein [Mizuhopecten yessoensis]|uniref:Mesenchyme-specific cell surface glycoprotein n=1 Tax=Mizuhopecten yessoensis TaxID=6573 RepID=A0A210R6J2_MIZYE|nr:Mesenchyme-specific cell surface glycoprotein [Mizuhopecten yessoensis]